MASTKFPPAMPATATRTGAAAVKTGAMKTAPTVTKAAPLVVKTAAGPTATGTTVSAAGITKTPLVIVFVDLARFQIASRRLSDEGLAELVQDYYERIADGLKGAGGRVVKFMGDGALLVFPIDRASQAVRTLLLLKQEIDARMAKRKFATGLVARVNAGEVMAGDFGAKADKRYDVIGNAVNRTAAMRYSEGISLTAEAYAKLDAKTQKLFRAKGDLFIAA